MHLVYWPYITDSYESIFIENTLQVSLFVDHSLLLEILRLTEEGAEEGITVN